MPLSNENTYRVPLEAKIADPKFSPVVYLAQRIEYSSARCSSAQYRIVMNRQRIQTLLDRLVQSAKRYDKPGGFDSRGRPNIPCKSNTIAIFVLLNEIFVGRHDDAKLIASKKNPNNFNSKTATTP